MIVSKIKELSKRGLFHIFASSIANKFLAFFTNILIVGFLTKDDYGAFSYANTIYSIALLATGLGLASGMLQFCSERRPDEEKNSIYVYCLTRGLFANVGLCAALLLIGFLAPLGIGESGQYLVALGPLSLLDYVVFYISIMLRTVKNNKDFARLQVISSLAYFIFGCLGAWVGGVFGTIAGRYSAFLLAIVFGLYCTRDLRSHFLGSGGLGSGIKKAIWGYSIPTFLTSSVNQLTYLLDVLLIGVFIQDADTVATYKVATLIPEGFLFIPTCLMTFALPYFIEHNKDRFWFSSKFIQLLLGSSVLYVLISLTLVFFAPLVISLLWGGAYSDAVVPFRILSISFFFSAIRST